MSPNRMRLGLKCAVNSDECLSCVENVAVHGGFIQIRINTVEFAIIMISVIEIANAIKLLVQGVFGHKGER